MLLKQAFQNIILNQKTISKITNEYFVIKCKLPRLKSEMFNGCCIIVKLFQGLNTDFKMLF